MISGFDNEKIKDMDFGKEPFCISVELIDYVFMDDEVVSCLLASDKRDLSKRICRRFAELGWRVVSHGPMNYNFWQSRRVLSMLSELIDEYGDERTCKIIEEIIKIHHNYLQAVEPASIGVDC